MEALSLLSSLNNVLHQHGGGNSADTAGNGGDGLNNGLDLVEDGVAGHAALALGGDLLGVPVHGNVDDDLALTDEVLGQGVQNTGSGDDDVSLAANSSGIHGLGVADGNGSILANEHELVYSAWYYGHFWSAVQPYKYYNINIHLWYRCGLQHLCYEWFDSR